MVAGSVAAPRLDLTNEALLRSHVQAVWLAETGEKLGSRMTDLLDTEGQDPSLVMRPKKAHAFADPDAIRRAIAHTRSIVAPMLEELRATAWWREDWVEDIVTKAPSNLDEACDRWRKLYRAALADQATQNRIVLESSRSQAAHRAAQARRREAESQLRLLRNEDDESNHSDFYTYRYLASEGFLPGYSFPRLPLAAYIPAVRGAVGKFDGGDYIQRPRFLAISEFGPGALIYHEGARYEVTRVQVPLSQTGQGVIDTSEARRCSECGYHHDRKPGLDVCENCGNELGSTTYGLMELTTVYTRRRERISSDEEERRRAGYELQTSYRFSERGNRSGSLAAAIVSDDGAQLADLAYGDSAELRVTNRGRRRRKDPSTVGFYLDPVEGKWLSESKGDDAQTDDGEHDPDLARAVRVIPYVRDHRNILVLRLAEALPDDAAATLRYALERGIEATFQLEDSELASESLPDPDHRGRMLFMESAEGGAGVLRRLQAEPGAMALAARTALSIAHFDPDTGADLSVPESGEERCERACYDCLLSYGNQSDHASIDRHTIRDLLLDLAAGRTISSSSGQARGEHADALMEAADSELERRWIRLLVEGEYKLPDSAQPLLNDAGCRPDFAYSAERVVIFIDGPVHDRPDKAAEDDAVQERLLDAGYTCIRFSHNADWAALVEENGFVFGEGRTA